MEHPGILAIRDLKAPAYVRFFYSLMQFLGTSVCLMDFRCHTLLFLILMVVQGNAFNMTLQRKKVTHHHGTVAAYSAMLLAILYLCMVELDKPKEVH